MRQMNRTILALVAGVGIAGGVSAWSQAQDSRPPQPPAARIATVDVLGIVERMLASDRYRPAQEAYLKQENDKLRPMADELAAIEERGSKLAQGSPELEALGREFDTKQEAFQRARQEGLTRIEEYNANQVREAYRLTLEAVDEVSGRMGYTHVVSSRTGDVTIKSQNVAGALQEILARPMARSPRADDLTERLIRQLRLENVRFEEPPARQPEGADRGPVQPLR